MALLTFLSRIDGATWFDFNFRLRAFEAQREAGRKFVVSREGEGYDA
jgi:hypothetical protein